MTTITGGFGHGGDRSQDRASRTGHRDDELAHRALFALTFAIFLPAAAVRRATSRSRGADQRRRSIVEEARVSASTVSAMAFMG